MSTQICPVYRRTIHYNSYFKKYECRQCGYYREVLQDVLDNMKKIVKKRSRIK